MEWIDKISTYISQTLHPQKIILFSQKKDLNGEVKSFKLCIVAAVENRYAAERDIYLGVDCDIPFDLLIYLPEEWEKKRQQEGSFAQRIDRMGRVLYG